jgi:hypothetical protein
VYAGAQTRHLATCLGVRHKRALFVEPGSKRTTEAANVRSISRWHECCATLVRWFKRLARYCTRLAVKGVLGCQWQMARAANCLSRARACRIGRRDPIRWRQIVVKP